MDRSRTTRQRASLSVFQPPVEAWRGTGATVDADTLLIEAKHELGLRDVEMRVARREVRRLRRARRAGVYRSVVRNAQTPSRVGCAALGSLAFLASLVMLADGLPQAADTLSAAGTFWALAVMLRPSE
ncbi:hypothetical protein OG782_29590 [Streptomyces sp. NBC_00876]|uniref:hypothetical protein n=1 Tax=Streptomyces sp. NBC_00876 TaxID=2975853 RepID=UPI00386FA3DE|nr:hypothetical protein OG782_29590 [Streptomyces sp. NBC_00876]